MFGLNARQILLLLLAAVAIFAATQYGPPYFYAFEFNDFIRQEVRFAASSRKPMATIRNEIVKKAEELAIPIGPKDIRITRRGPAFTLELDYVSTVDMKFYKQELQFHLSESGETFDQ